MKFILRTLNYSADSRWNISFDIIFVKTYHIYFSYHVSFPKLLPLNLVAVNVPG
jgi:hypothetical protein